MTNKEYKTIKISNEMFNSLKELKILIIQHGYNDFPKNFTDYLTQNNFKFINFSNGNMLKLLELTIKYLLTI